MQYPYLLRWVNECLCCHRKGYKPDMPRPDFDNWVVIRAKLRRLTNELPLEEGGLCEQCREAKNIGQQRLPLNFAHVLNCVLN
jgi:hypothetical protein